MSFQAYMKCLRQYSSLLIFRSCGVRNCFLLLGMELGQWRQALSNHKVSYMYVYLLPYLPYLPYLLVQGTLPNYLP
jgi:hypothetical protein